MRDSSHVIPVRLFLCYSIVKLENDWSLTLREVYAILWSDDKCVTARASVFGGNFLFGSVKPKWEVHLHGVPLRKLDDKLKILYFSGTDDSTQVITNK